MVYYDLLRASGIHRQFNIDTKGKRYVRSMRIWMGQVKHLALMLKIG